MKEKREKKRNPLLWKKGTKRKPRQLRSEDEYGESTPYPHDLMVAGGVWVISERRRNRDPAGNHALQGIDLKRETEFHEREIGALLQGCPRKEALLGGGHHCEGKGPPERLKGDPLVFLLSGFTRGCRF